MKYLKNKYNTPLWYILTTSFFCLLLIAVTIIRPQLLLLQGVSLDDIGYVRVIDSIPPVRGYAGTWSLIDNALAFACLIFALFAFILGILRSYYKLGDCLIYLMAASAVLFSLNMLSTSSIIQNSMSPYFQYYLYWFTFYFYPIPFLVLLYSPLSDCYKKWMQPFILIPAVYSVTSWVMYLTVGLSFSVSERIFSVLGGICFGILFLSCLIHTIIRKKFQFIIALSCLWIILGIFIIAVMISGQPYHLFNMFKTFAVLHVLFSLCYMLFLYTKELFQYKSDVSLLELKNTYLLENYQNLESHFTQVSQMKHEIQHHLFAIHTLLREGKTEQLSDYLSDITKSYRDASPLPFCNNRMIQAILSHTSQCAKQNGFEVTFELIPLPSLPVSDSDIVSLFMNLLDNAMESCLSIKDPSQRWIDITLKVKKSYLYICVSNARTGIICPDNQAYRSIKKDTLRHGNGIAVITRIAKKYDGFVQFKHTEQAFYAEVSLKVISPVSSPSCC